MQITLAGGPRDGETIHVPDTESIILLPVKDDEAERRLRALPGSGGRIDGRPEMQLARYDRVGASTVFQFAATR
jgi:hypothetical protein